MTDMLPNPTQNHLLFNGKDAQILVAGQVNKFKAKAGSRYRILKIVNDSETQLLEDVVAKRQVNDLSLSYADGTEVVLLDYYVECADAVASDVTLPAENSGGYSLNSASPAGVSLDSSSNLLYAYGSHDAIYAMAQSNPAMQSSFKEIGGAHLGYLPATESFAYSPGLVAIVDGALLGLMALGVSAGGTAAVPGNNIISGTVVAGPIVVNNGLSVAIYSADGGKLLGSGKVSNSGTYRVDVGSYSGVVIAKLIDDDPVGGNNVDYIDEATGNARDITAKFMSVGEVIPGISNLNINALTTVAASKAGVVYADPISGSLLAPTATPVAAATVQQVSSAIAKAFGLTDLHGNSIVTTVDISGKANAAYTPGTPTPAMNYGAVLAALSGADAGNGGNMQTTVDALISNITVTGSTAKLSDSAINTIMVGARVATDTTSGADASRLTAIVSNLTVQASTSISIDHVAVDDVINSAEQSALISGTTVSGAAVKLSLGGNTRNATVTGTHWEYTLVPADMAGMQEGGETITATATLSGGGTAVATRGIVVDTVAPANAGGVAVSGAGSGNATANSTPTITGSAEAGTTVKLTENSVTLGTGTTAANGQWNITSNKLSEGTHTIGVNLTDPAGNSNPNAGSVTLVVDTNPPLNAGNITVPGAGAGNATNDTTPTLTGTAEAGSTVKIYDSNGTTLLGESTTDANGSWRVTSSTLSNGTHSITAKLSDAAGNTNANAGAVDVRIDTTSPAAVANVLVSGATGNFSKSSTPTLTGTGESGSTIKLYDTGGTTLLGTTTADGNGNWSITGNGLAEGTHTLIIKVTDVAGNTNSSAGALDLTVDTTAPQATIDSISTGTISGTCEAGASVNVQVANGTIVQATVSGSTWSYTFSAADISVFSTAPSTLIKVSASDTAGNTASISRNVSATQFSPPSIVEFMPADGGTLTNGLTNTVELQLTFSEAVLKGSGNLTLYNLADNSVFESIPVTSNQVTISGTESKNVIINTSASMTLNNQYYVTLDAGTFKDLQGNNFAGQAITGTAGWDFTVASASIKSTAVATDNMINANEAGGVISLQGTIVSSPAIVGAVKLSDITVSVTENNSTTTLATTLSSYDPLTGVFVANVPAASWADGKTYTYAYSLSGTTGAAANVTANYSFNKLVADLTAPATKAFITTLNDDVAGITGTLNSGFTCNDTAPVLSGTLSQTLQTGERLVLYRNEGSGNTRLTNDNGLSIVGTTWTYSDAGLINGKTYTYQAVIEDAAGNQSTPGSNFIVSIDTVAPAVNQIAITSANGMQNGFLNAGDSVNLTVTFSKATIVSGNPRLALLIGNSTVFAEYVSGSGTSDLIFSYTIQTNQTDLNGISVNANSLSLNGGSFADSAGNAAVLSHSAIVDNAAYQVDNSSPANVAAITVSGAGANNLINIVTPTLTGTGEAGSTVKIYASDGTLLGSGIVDSSGNWRITTTTLPQGTQTVSLTITDAAGNINSTAGSVSLTVDTVAPSSSLAISLVKDTGANTTDKITSDGTLKVSGAETNVSVEYSNDNKTWAGSITPTEGKNMVYVRQTDVAGNSSASSVFYFELDRTGSLPPLINNIANDNIINELENGISVSGTAEANSTVALTLGGNTRTLTADAGGSWSYTLIAADITAMGQGSETLSATATDAAGNTGSAGTKNISIDTAAPASNFGTATDNAGSVTGVLLNGARSDDTALELAGSCEAGSTVNVYNGGTLLGAASVTGSSWRYTATLANGSAYQFNVKETDSAGNTGAATSNFTVIGDSAAPSAPIINAVAGDDILSAGEQSAVISGSAEANSTVALTLGGNTRTLTADAGGSWSYTLIAADMTAMGQGAETLSATATDAAGNTGSAGTRGITLNTDGTTGTTPDTTPPGAPLLGIVASDNLINSDEQSAVISGSAEANSTVALTLGGNTRTLTADAGGSWSYTLIAADMTAMGQGAETLSATATDAAGNTGSAGTKNISIDTVAPTSNFGTATDNAGSVTGVLLNGARSDDTALELAGSCEAGSTVNVYNGGTLLGAASVTGSSWRYNATLANGSAYQFNVKETDSAGNTGAATSNFTVIGDSAAPAAPTINAVAGDDILSAGEQSAVISGSAEANSTVALTLGGNTRTLTADAGGNWSYTLIAADITAMGQGSETLSATATDAAGNTGSAGTKNISIDTVAPTAPVINTVAGDDIVAYGEESSIVSGTAEAYSTIKLTLGGNTRTLTADANDNWSYTLIAADITAMGHGAETLSATATDTVGNISPAGTRSITVSVIPAIELSDIAAGVGGFVINGQAVGDQSGYSVASAGDVNGDGLADLILGANTADPAGLVSAGRSYVVFGKTSNSVVDLSAVATGTGGFVINGQSANDFSGASVSSIGDINNDGLSDLLIGAYQADPSSGSNAGRSYVVFGKTSTTAIELSAIVAGNGGFVINGQSASDWSGVSVASAGDVNHDGINDLIVGANYSDPVTGANAGRSYLVFGKTSGTPVELSTITTGVGGFVIVGEKSNDSSGYSVSAAGDVNNDGLSDLLVGSLQSDPNGVSNAGRSFVVFGKTDSTAVDLVNVAAGNGGFVINGQSANDYSGNSVAGIGDVNGDGRADILVGAYQSDPAGGSNAGRSYVIFGKADTASVNLSSVANGQGGFVINGLSANDYSGVSVAAAGDVNGDGLADMIIGAFQADPASGSNAGRSYVVFGKASNTAIDLSAVAIGLGGFVINGQATNDASGFSVSAAGDVNGDGLADLLVGAYQSDPTTALSNAGRSYVIFGSTSGAFKHSAVDQLGSDQADVITGNVNAETLVGGNGNDTLIGNGGADVLYGGAGNDIIQLNAGNLAALAANFGVGGNDTQLARINGGSGIDILKLDGSGLTLDLTAISNQAGTTTVSSSRIESIETIDLSGTGNNTVILKVEDVLDLSGSNLINSGNQAALGWTNGSYSFSAQETRHQLLVTGDSGDVIQLSGGASWTSAGTVSNSGHTYSVYTHNALPAELLIDQLLSYNTLA